MTGGESSVRMWEKAIPKLRLRLPPDGGNYPFEGENPA